MLTLATSSSSDTQSICNMRVVVRVVIASSLATDHDVVTVEVQPGQLPVQAVYEGHPLRHVDGELHGAGRVHHQPRALVQHRVQAPNLEIVNSDKIDEYIKLTNIYRLSAHRHVLADDHEVGRGVAAADDGQHVGVGEDPQLGILLVEVPGYPRRALPQRQDLRSDLIPLPLAPPSLAARPRNIFTVKYFLVKGKNIYVVAIFVWR